MKSKFLPALGGAIFLSTVLAWMHGGMQVYYKTSYGVKMVDEITGLEYEERVSAFLPGAETLLVGFFLMTACLFLASVWERRSSVE